MPGHSAAATPSIHHLLMKTIRPLALLLALTPALLHAQGSLTPPAGLPVASMKTLDQVEARTPLVTGATGVAINAAGTITISQSGSYYLTRKITVATGHGIVIATGLHDVSIDLSGFTIESTLATGVNGDAISAEYSDRLRISNGNIKGGSTVQVGTLTARGFSHGILVGNGTLISGVNITGVNDAIYCGNSIVENCTIASCSFGIRNLGGCTHHCSVANCSHIGIESDVIESCKAAGYLIRGINGVTVINSNGDSNQGPGLYAAETATNCTGHSITNIGLSAETATNCTGSSGSGTGLYAITATNCTGTTISTIPSVIGLEVYGTASNCRGRSEAGAIALKAAIAIGCTYSGGTLSVPVGKQFNM